MYTRVLIRVGRGAALNSINFEFCPPRAALRGAAARRHGAARRRGGAARGAAQPRKSAAPRFFSRRNRRRGAARRLRRAAPRTFSRPKMNICLSETVPHRRFKSNRQLETVSDMQIFIFCRLNVRGAARHIRGAAPRGQIRREKMRGAAFFTVARRRAPRRRAARHVAAPNPGPNTLSIIPKR